MIDHSNLEEFQDPANYDLEENDRSQPRVAFYRDLALEIGGPVLEVACGSGIVAIPLARAGLDVTGVDLARPMLEHARARADALGLTMRWVEADARSFELGATFRFIYLTGNAFQAFLTRPDQEQLLAAVRRHLVPGGIFAFETRNPSGTDLSHRPEEEEWFSYTDTGGRPVRVSGTQRYDPIAQLMHWVTYRRHLDAPQQPPRVTRIACRFTHPQELEALLHCNGFAILAQYGSWDRSPVGADSPSLFTVCRLA